MNTRRLVVLLLAAGAAGVIAFMVRGFFGGGAKQAEASIRPAEVSVTQVLVAATRLEPGQPLAESQVRWQSWPSRQVDSSFIVKSAALTSAAAVQGTVVRSPMVEGEPVTYAKIVRSQSAGFMAATIAPGMRAVSINVSVASVAGGFILPNDRVDLICTVMLPDKRGVTRTVLSNVRVLAIDQSAAGKDNKAVSDVKTATLELSPRQAEMVQLAQAMGTLSLSLRSLGDNDSFASNSKSGVGSEDGESTAVTVIRYGMGRRSTASSGGQ
ncbi:MAG TPA: Flp pilus assembly protein CpaB [Rhizomicrobium sp.]|nr:Flp pilus assembly protein CpaB [Rhizomicrobium sp.]